MTLALEPTTVVSLGGTVTTVWGMSALELHDAYWRTMGVAVVRPGGPVAADAGLYLLCDGGTSVVLDFRKVLDVMGWMTPELCMVRARAGALPAGQSPADAGAAARCAFTPRSAVAGAWSASRGGFSAWRGLKQRLLRERVCIARPRGRVVTGASAEVVLERLAVVWEDPTQAVSGLKRIARGAFALSDGAGKGAANGGQTNGGSAIRIPHVWVGKGRRFDEVRGGGRACVLRDAVS